LEVGITPKRANRALRHFIYHFSTIAGLGTQQYLSSEGHEFGKTLAAAEAATAEARYSDAMKLYKNVYDNSDSYRLKAGAAMGDIMREDRLKSVSNAELAGMLDSYNSFASSPLPRMHDSIYNLALERVKTDTGEDDVGLHSLLHETQELNPEGEDLTQIDTALVKSINAQDPTNLEAAVEISDTHFLAGNFEAVKQVLNPVKDKLGDSEGARILAQTYIGEGRNAEAYPLLSAYTSTRLDSFQKAEARFTEVSEGLWESEFTRLNTGLGPDSFYDQYEDTPESEKPNMVDAYVGEIVYKKPKYINALSNYREAPRKLERPN